MRAATEAATTKTTSERRVARRRRYGFIPTSTVWPTLALGSAEVRSSAGGDASSSPLLVSVAWVKSARRFVVLVGGALMVLTGMSPQAVAQDDPGSRTPSTSTATVPASSVEFQPPFPLESFSGPQAPLIAIPEGCQVPAAPTAVFVGTIVENSGSAARFEVRQVRAGSLRGLATGNLVDVLYDQETRFLSTGTTYIVGVKQAADGLHSAVRDPAPRFGGDAVIGVNDTDTPCPTVEDPIRTLTLAGRPIDSGTFSEMTSSTSALAKAVLGPLLIGFVVLLGLVLVKHLLFGTGRSLKQVLADEAEQLRRPVAPRTHGRR